MPPIIPGAWSSTWTLDSLEEQDDMDADKTPRLPDSHASYSGLLQRQGSEKFDLAFTKTPSLKGRSISVEEAAHIDGEGDKDSVSFADDDSSTPSEDFYSIISYEDTESTLFPSIILSTSPLANEKDYSDGPLDSPDLLGSPFDASELGSSLHIASQIDACASENLSSDASIIPASAPFIEDVPHSVDNMGPPNTLGFCSPDISACGQVDAPVDALAAIDPVTYTSDDDSPVDPHGYECDSVSSHSDSISVEREISSLMARLGVNASRPSVNSWSGSSSMNQSPRITHHGHIDDTPFGSEVTSNLRLSQPDGDNPWTLSLDPTLTSAESEAASIAALSLDDNERASVISRDTLPSMASFRRPSSPHTPPYEEEIVFTPRGSHSSAYGVPLEPRTTSGPSPLTSSHSNDSVHSKNFLQKTKELCSKFKNFISLKAIKGRRSNATKERSGIRRTPLKNQVENNTPSTFTSFEKQRAFRATAKTSSPSVALSYTPSYTISRSSNHVSDEKYTYEYHARPKALHEIRSRRRFSLPAFARSPSPIPPIARNVAPSSKLQGTGSMLSAEGGMIR